MFLSLYMSTFFFSGWTKGCCHGRTHWGRSSWSGHRRGEAYDAECKMATVCFVPRQDSFPVMANSFVNLSCSLFFKTAFLTKCQLTLSSLFSALKRTHFSPVWECTTYQNDLALPKDRNWSVTSNWHHLSLTSNKITAKLTNRFKPNAFVLTKTIHLTRGDDLRSGMETSVTTTDNSSSQD